jgi:transposase-like protein/IS1 family transposase
LAGKGQVNCRCCQSESIQRHGFYRNKSFTVQRYICPKCGTSFSEKQPLENLRVDFKQACQVVRLLTEGCGIRAVSRLTGLHQQTVLNILARAGSTCARLLDEKIHVTQPGPVQVDELFCYVGCKERNNTKHDYYKGDQYLFLALASESKLILSYIVGKRDKDNALALMKNLKQRIACNFQLTTDGFHPYKYAVPQGLPKQTDFAQLIKLYANPIDGAHGERRYSASQCIGSRVVVRRGKPDPAHISTSHIERANLTVRLFNRRFTRLTLGYSKKFEYLLHSTALFVAHYNFIHKHRAHGQTPAQAAGLTDHVWTVEELLCAESKAIVMPQNKT